MVDNSPIMKEMSKYTAFQIATKVLGKFYLLFFLPHCFMPFALLKHAIYLPGNNLCYGQILHIYWKTEINNISISCTKLNLYTYLYFTVLWSTRAMVLVFFGTWPIWKHPMKMLLKPVKPKKEETDNTSNKSEVQKKEN